MNRKASAITLVALLAGLLSGCVSRAISQSDLYQDYFDEPLPGPEATVAYENVAGIHVLHLSGDEYSMGYAYGEQAAELGIATIYQEIFANATAMLAQEVPEESRRHMNVKRVKALLLEGWRRMEPYTPHYVLRMLAGFTAGSGLPVDDVLAMHAIPDFTETSCSALWAGVPATFDGSAVQIRVLDYIMDLGIQQYPAVVFMEFDEGHTVANIGWLGLLGVISGMNATGLAVSEMGYGNPEGEHFHATPMPFLLLDVLRWSATPEQASGIIRSTPRTNSYVYIVGSADAGGLAFITNAYSVESFAPGDTDATVPQFAGMLHAGHYQERMDALVADNHGLISMAWLQEEFIPQIAMDSNLQVVIYDLDNLRFRVANAPDRDQRAADSAYHQFGFDMEYSPSRSTSLSPEHDDPEPE